jgi:hypothetical protein
LQKPNEEQRRIFSVLVLYSTAIALIPSYQSLDPLSSNDGSPCKCNVLPRVPLPDLWFHHCTLLNLSHSIPDHIHQQHTNTSTSQTARTMPVVLVHFIHQPGVGLNSNPGSPTPTPTPSHWLRPSNCNTCLPRPRTSHRRATRSPDRLCLPTAKRNRALARRRRVSW